MDETIKNPFNNLITYTDSYSKRRRASAKITLEVYINIVNYQS
jgi:hypothetical protein